MEYRDGGRVKKKEYRLSDNSEWGAVVVVHSQGERVTTALLRKDLTLNYACTPPHFRGARSATISFVRGKY